MNYQTHYDNLVARSKSRTIDGYVEKHHIVPKCLGGSNDSSNIASLTAREHYVAHQLLVKLHPDNLSLVRAANMMTIGKEKHHRILNREYGWIKTKNAEVRSIQSKAFWERDDYREKLLNVVLDPINKESRIKGMQEYWANPENRKRQGEAAKRSNSTRWLGRVKPEKVVKKKGPASQEAKDRISKAKLEWWAKKKENGGYKEVCEKISKGTKVAMQNPIVRNNHANAISARWN